MFIVVHPWLIPHSFPFLFSSFPAFLIEKMGLTRKNA